VTARWRDTDPVVVDALLAALCGLVTFITLALTDASDAPNLTPAAVLFLLAQTAPVAWRRSHPVLAWAVVGCGAVAYGIGDYPDTVLDVGPLLVIFSVAAYCRRRTATTLGVATAAAILVSLSVAGDADAEDYSFNLLVYAVAWIAGENQRTRRAYTAELEAKAARLEQERLDEARRAVSDERARIASELHDVVAHHVSMMVVQAEGGASVVDRSPEEAAKAFDAISTAGRDAMTEMRRVLGVLRNEDDGADRRVAPQPGLGALDDLVERVRQAGLAVDLVRDGSPRPLAAGVDLSAYRIVQEALTNTLRHAGAASATVVVRYLEGAVEVEVADDGRGPDSSTGVDSNGHGLVGMRERVALYGGDLRVGAREGGGFAVTARLPTGP
jgi:signal transduction histidine kinase